MKEPLNKGTDEEFIPRVRWSELDHYVPFKIRITDWKGLKIAKYGKVNFLLLPSEMEYNHQKIQLCIPYNKFIKLMQGLGLTEQKAIISGKATLELVKTYYHDGFGMRLKVINNS